MTYIMYTPDSDGSNDRKCFRMLGSMWRHLRSMYEYCRDLQRGFFVHSPVYCVSMKLFD